MAAALDADLVIAGAGPAGLSLAAALSGAPLRLLLFERAKLSEIAEPRFDGREIALTQASMRSLRELGAWHRIKPSDISPLTRARVLNGESEFALYFSNRRRGEALGALVPNAAIRRALFDVVSEQANCTIITDQAVISLQSGEKSIAALVSGGRCFAAHLAIAADTRFSPLRQSQGISAHMIDFGRSMLVCRMTHAIPHQGIATEWFDRGQTVAMLPLQDGMSSFVLTLPARQVEMLLEMSPEAFAAEAQRRTLGKWGAMSLASTRHAYPLVAVYADRFVAPRFAVVGDAAVGMHPVTAHGYNFGLASAMTLAGELHRSAREGGDIGRLPGLLRYQRMHRRATWPLFLATNAIARLYSDERFLPRIARSAGLRLMRAAIPLRRAVEARLSG